MALTNAAVKAAELPSGKNQIKLADRHGLYLLINRSGKYWRYDYKLDGKRKTLSIGAYPTIPLAGKINKSKEYEKGARDLAIEAKAMVKAGVDPSVKKQSDKQEAIAKDKAIEVLQTADANTFEVIALQWHNTKKKGWSKKHAETIAGRFNNHVFPHIGHIPVTQLQKTEVADVITKLVSFNTIETAHRISQIIKQVLEYACDLGLIELIPMGNTKNIIPVHKATPMPAITDTSRLGELLRATEEYGGTFVVCQALRLLPLVALRSTEFREAKWSEIDLDAAIWTVPATHRKLTVAQKADPLNAHLVPLSKQAVRILKSLYEFTGHSGFVFFSARSKSQVISENTINDAYKSMGFTDHVGHGWRSVFSTILNEKGFNPDAIEKQLAHVDENTIRATYNRGKYLKKRTKIMQKWANILDKTRLKELE